MGQRVYSARVMKYRRSVFAARTALTPGCQLLLLRLSDSMSADCSVSIPQRTLAVELVAPESRISEWVKEAIEKGALSRKVKGRPGVTSEYQGLDFNPYDLRRRVSATYARRDEQGVRPGVSGPRSEDRSDLRPAPTPVMSKSQAEGSDPTTATRLRVVASADAGSDERSVS